MAIGIEIGGTKTQVGLGSVAGEVLPDGIVRRPVSRERGAEGIRRDLIEMVAELLGTRKLSLADIAKIGIGFGGILNSAQGLTLKSFQIDGWTNFPLRQWAEETWGRPVFLENDASTAALAEARRGNGVGYRRVFYVTVGSGVGGSWIVDGRIDNGQGWGAAEIGHMWVPDPVSGAPAELEQICSGWGLGVRAREAAGAASLMVKLAGSRDGIDAKVVYAAAEQGDALARRLLHETCATLALGLSNVVALLHPERVIVGGGVALMGALFWDDLQQEFQRRVLPTFAPHVELVPAQLKEAVVVSGALCLG